MEKIEQNTSIKYRHQITYKGEEIGVDIIKKKNSNNIVVLVYTPVRDDFVSRARFYRQEKANKSTGTKN